MEFMRLTPGPARPARWAWMLSLLAVCAALWSPADALSQDMAEGRWSVLCSGGTAESPGPQGHSGDAHDPCGACWWPALVLPWAVSPRVFDVSRGGIPVGRAAALDPVPQARPPFIRGPPPRV